VWRLDAAFFVLWFGVKKGKTAITKRRQAGALQIDAGF
jgi:hypothetical protein